MMEVKTNELNWSAIILATIFFIISGLGVGIVIRDILYAQGQTISALYGIVSAIFITITGVILMFALSILKQK